jgi:hypothetical protein
VGRWHIDLASFANKNRRKIMLKFFAIATVLSASFVTMATLPAEARPSKSDCDYVQQFKDVANSVGGSNGYSYWKQQLQACSAQ